jgi:hypothetical protein
MALQITHAPTLAAIRAALPTQTAQIAAFMAAFPGGSATVKILNGAVLLSTVVAPLTVNAAANPIQVNAGARVSRSFAAPGSMTRVVLANNGGTDIAELTSGVGSGDVPFVSAITALRKERFSFAILASAALPVGATPPPVGPTVANLVSGPEVGPLPAGSYPYKATVAALRGQVPAGSTLRSVDDPSLRASVINRHSDGSAAFIVVAGLSGYQANQTRNLSLQTSTATDTPLTAAAISALVTSVSVAFDGGYGTATLTDFSNPERIWWANGAVICARYRMPAPNPGATALEAVVDIHAWQTRALVEGVIENCKLVPTQATPIKPTAATYTSAVVSVNGTAISAPVSGNGIAGETGHNAFRAWRFSGWVGGNPGLLSHQLHTELQQHPLLFKCSQTQVPAATLTALAADTYTPFGYGRLPDANMGGVGDADFIGPITKWDAFWLQSGDKQAANAVNVQAAHALSFNINYRSSVTGRIPTFTEIDGKSINGNQSWPKQTSGANNTVGWELMHHPAVGLMWFLLSPSPMAIELAQKISVWNAMWQTNFVSGIGVIPTGVWGYGTVSERGQGWGFRSAGHALALTPDELSPGVPDPWKAPARANLAANVAYQDGFRTSSLNKLNTTWGGTPTAPGTVDNNAANGGPGFAIRGWFQQYLLDSYYKITAAGLLSGSDTDAATDQGKLARFTDWMLQWPVRWVNEQPNGGWRFLPYSLVIGRNLTTIDSPNTWAEIRAYQHTDTPSSVSGPWAFATDNGVGVTTYAGYNSSDSNRPRYVDYFWITLVDAVERGIPGSRQAWATVTSQVTNLSTWLTGFQAEPRYGSTPKVIGETYGVVETAVNAIAPGAWADISSVTNVATITDTDPGNSAPIAWFECDTAVPRTLFDWPGNLTWDYARANVITVGCGAGHSSDSPAGLYSSALTLPLKTGQFRRVWGAIPANLAHQYDANSTTIVGRHLYRRAYSNGGLYRQDLTTGVWTFVLDSGSAWGNSNFGNAQSPSLEHFPTLGKMGSIVVASASGALARLDLVADTPSVIQSTALTGVGGPEVICAYHPGIDSVIFGGGSGGTRLYQCNRAGVVSSFLTAFPPGVTGIGPQIGVRSVLAPDPQGRSIAWLFDPIQTGKVWRLDLITKAWALAGDCSAAADTCYATVPPLGAILGLDSRTRNGAISQSKVWGFRPA